MSEPAPTTPTVEMNVFEALQSRRSIRAFTARPVPSEMVERILALASRAPSGSNIQPWKVHVVAGAAKERLSAELERRHFAGEAPPPEYSYYPSEWREPYQSRRRKTGFGLYALLGIGKEDTEARSRQHARNYRFFDAPVGLIFTIDRDLELGSWLDYGMFLQSIMLAARGFGLDTCPQQALARYHDSLRRHLSIPEGETVVCGMALGYANADAPENRLVTEREPVSGFATFHQE